MEKDDRTNNSVDFDVFISHASENKDQIVRPLAEELSEIGLGVWYDEFELSLGDSLRTSIDKGLQNSDYGVVVFSEAFFEKEWTRYELNGLVSRQNTEGEVILPLWYNIGDEDIRSYSPPLADLVAMKIHAGNIDDVAEAIYDEVAETEPELAEDWRTKSPKHGRICEECGEELEYRPDYHGRQWAAMVCSECGHWEDV